MTTEKNITAQAMRQDVLNRLDASRKAILELSDDELESIAGGWKGLEKRIHEQKSPSVLRAPEKNYGTYMCSEGGLYAGEMMPGGRRVGEKIPDFARNKER